MSCKVVKIVLSMILVMSLTLLGQGGVMRPAHPSETAGQPLKSSMISSSWVEGHRYQDPFSFNTVNAAGDRFSYSASRKTVSFCIRNMGPTNSAEKKLSIVLNDVDIEYISVKEGHSSTERRISSYEHMDIPSNSLSDALRGIMGDIGSVSYGALFKGYELGTQRWSDEVMITIKLKGDLRKDFIISTIVRNPSTFENLKNTIGNFAFGSMLTIMRLLGESSNYRNTSFVNYKVEAPLSSGTGQSSGLIDMVFIEGGTFEMGGTESDEKPVHSVTLDNYLIGKTEITQAQWEAVMGNNPSHFKGNELPVEMISWYDAVEFCNRLSEMEGLEKCYKISKNIKDENNKSVIDKLKYSVDFIPYASGYRLPTHPEWYYAAIGGNKSKGYEYSGSNNIEEVGWHYGDSRDDDYWTKIRKEEKKFRTHKVGLKQSNEIGIYDMTGNVNEWCWDWYKSDYKTNGSIFGRTIAGGSWFNISSECSVLEREFGSPDRSHDCIASWASGLRVVRNAKTKIQKRNDILIYKSDSNFSVFEKKILLNQALDEVAVIELNEIDARLLRNTIFARYGRSFISRDLQEYFSSKEWYSVSTEYNDRIISEADKHNINLLQLAEERNKLDPDIFEDFILLFGRAVINEDFDEILKLISLPIEDSRLIHDESRKLSCYSRSEFEKKFSRIFGKSFIESIETSKYCKGPYQESGPSGMELSIGRILMRSSPEIVFIKKHGRKYEVYIPYRP